MSVANDHVTVMFERLSCWVNLSTEIVLETSRIRYERVLDDLGKNIREEV